MDDLTLMQSFRAERVKDDGEARAEIRRMLEVRFGSAPAPATPSAVPARRRGLLPGRRRLLAFAGATAAAAVVAGVLVLSSGPTAQPAAAEILHETAAVAASSNAPATSPLPGPGQFLYGKIKRLELEGWVPADESSKDAPLGIEGAPYSGPDAAKSFTALMPTTQESWTALDGAGRFREVGGAPRFLTNEERSRWEAAGSPLPASSTVDSEHGKWKGFHFPDTSSLPTEPEALRRAIESNQIPVSGFNLIYASAKRLDTEKMIRELFNILVEGNPTPQLQAAAFNALSELPGIEVDTDATDFLGRQGYAIRSIDPRSGGGTEFIFDPDTAELLAQREFINDAQLAARQDPNLKGLPSGLTLRETAYLESGNVDSTRETSAEAEAGGPVATIGPTYRK